MGEVVRMFNGGAGEWCLASQEEEQIAEVGISENDTTNKVVKERGCAKTTSINFNMVGGFLKSTVA